MMMHCPAWRLPRLAILVLVTLLMSSVLPGTRLASPVLAGSGGTLYAWGTNYYGERGIAFTADSAASLPVLLPAGVTATAIAAGDYFSLALGSDGNVYAWGDNGVGQLGNGSTVSSPVPVRVLLPAGVRAIAVAAGPWHSLALGSDGTLYAWGNNLHGQLGNGSTVESNVPVRVQLPVGVTATAIASGGGHSLAIGSDGALYAWGYNYYGQLGIGSTEGSDVPAPAPARVQLPAGVAAVAIAAGQDKSLALGSDGALYAWGDNGFGQLGN
jgi:alpha-tubulin suppressor-like RCC1 family protein